MIPLTTKRVLQKLGGDKETKTLTNGGNGVGIDLFGDGNLYAKISDESVDIDTLSKIVISYNGTDLPLDGTGLNVIISEAPEAEWVVFSGDGTMLAIYILDGTANDGIGLYVLTNPDFYVKSMTFETIVPIDPKFLPGVTIDLGEYGFDPLSLFMSGGGSQTVEDADALWQKINDADGDVQFSANLGDLIVMTPITKNHNAEHGWWLFGFTLITVNSGAIMKADVTLGYTNGGAVLTMKLA